MTRFHTYELRYWKVALDAPGRKYAHQPLSIWLIPMRRVSSGRPVPVLRHSVLTLSITALRALRDG
jgi:hypothetical protein